MEQIRILLIEDNSGDIVLISEYIEEQFSNAQISVARSYEEIITTIKKEQIPFDILLLDLNLPDKNGEALINEIVAHPQIKCPVIILTGYADIEFSIKSISLGISDYLLKDELTSVMLHKSIIYAHERWASKLRIQESEIKFSNLFNLSPQPMWVYDFETLKFILVNKAAIDHYGYSEEEFLRMNLLQLHISEEKTLLKKLIKNTNSECPNFTGNFKHIKKSGEEIEVELYSTSLLIDGRPHCTIIAIDVTEKNTAELKLTQAIIKTQEEERYTIGSELHDNVCQILVGSMLHLSTLKSSLDERKTATLLDVMEKIKLASTEIRNLSHRLAPVFFDDMMVKESFSRLLSSASSVGNFKTQLHFDVESDSIKLKKDLQINLYRVMQEQLNNILKYANASNIIVSFSINSGSLKFQISDNGVGFNEESVSKGIGFANMNRRAKLFSGNFIVKSAPNEGCKITITIPEEHLN